MTLILNFISEHGVPIFLVAQVPSLLSEQIYNLETRVKSIIEGSNSHEAIFIALDARFFGVNYLVT